MNAKKQHASDGMRFCNCYSFAPVRTLRKKMQWWH